MTKSLLEELLHIDNQILELSKKREELVNQSNIKELRFIAEILHDNFCELNHSTECGYYFYGTVDEYKDKEVWLKCAENATKIFNKEDITKILKKYKELKQIVGL